MRRLNTVVAPSVLLVAATGTCTTIDSDRCGVHFSFPEREQRNRRSGWRCGWSGHVFVGGQ